MKYSSTENAEFKKFVFFQRKYEERKDFVNKVLLLICYGKTYQADIRKAMRISSDRLDGYLRGDIPLPDGFITKFEEKFKEEIKRASNAKRKAYLDGIEGLAVKLPLLGDNAQNMVDPEKSATI